MAYKLAVVYGGCGALGRVFVSKLKLSGAYEVISIDFTPSAEADNNVLVTELSDWSRQSSDVIGQLDKVVGKRRNIDLIACVAGGWAGGSAAELDVVKNSDLMWKQSVWSSLICAQISSKWSNPDGGLLQLTGAVPSLGGTPGMLGYGMAKAAVHQLTHSLAAPGSGIPEGSSVVAILPVTLDTPMNRKFMPDADFTSWTSLEFVVDTVMAWHDQSVDARPKNGALVQFVTKDDVTDLIIEK
ncbi:dihydropteridine reductase-like [Symsagittifera roscoffensis]|uniref:dihydropteridine reductase-like n=1 Tax=Symsagittifera roscoffensis TaxID=84072 RepID=UPI00307B2F2A